MSEARDLDLRRRAWVLAEEWIALGAGEQEDRLRELETRDESLARSVRSLLLGSDSGQPPAPPPTWIGVQLGDYRIVRPLGSGGMGRVFEAHSSKLDRHVALKLMLEAFHDEDSLRRFEYEARVQARSSHPNIARVYDTGYWTNPEGQSLPWIAMELVPEARTLGDYVGAARLTTRQTVELFASVCDAVGFAHDLGILHRDVKPSNVLVDGQGRPVVIDFGTARLADADSTAAPRTRVGLIVGTPRYMAPERLDPGRAPRSPLPGARADVFSLGLVLHELLTGRPRFAAPRIVEDLGGWLRGLELGPRERLDQLGHPVELEWMVSKATAFDAHRRYANAAGLAEDLRRFLRHEPPLAVPESNTYRLRLFLRRNRTLATSSAIVTLSLVVGGGLAVRSRLREVEAAAVAKTTTEEMASSYQFLERLLSHIEPHGVESGEPLDLMEALEHAYEESPQAIAPWRVDALLAPLFQRGGRTDLAIRVADQALAHAPSGSSEAVRVLAVQRAKAHALLDARKLEEAEGLLLNLGEKTASDPALASTHSSIEAELGVISFLRLEYPEAERRLRMALEWQRKHLGDQNETTASTEQALGVLFIQMRRFDEAREHLASSLQAKEQLFGASHPLVFRTTHQIALAFNEEGRFQEALDLLEEALLRCEHILPEDHPDRLGMNSALAHSLVELGNYERALKLREANTKIREKLYGPSDERVVTERHNLAFCALKVGQYSRALGEFDLVVRERTASLGADHPLTLTSLGMMAQAAGFLGRSEEALEMARRAYEGISRAPAMGPKHPNAQTMLGLQASFLQDLGRYEESAAKYEEALALASEVHPRGHPSTQRLRGNLATLYVDMERFDEARELHESNIVDLEERGLAGTPDHILCMSNLAYLLLKQGKPNDALELLMSCEEAWPASLDRGHPQFLAVHVNMTRAMIRTGDIDGAKERIALIERADPNQKRLPELKSELAAALQTSAK